MNAALYKAIHDEIFARLPAWKQKAITEDRAAGRLDSSVLVDFTAAVLKRAEALDRPDQPQLLKKPYKAKAYYDYNYKTKA